jgi:hypothetical protein
MTFPFEGHKIYKSRSFKKVVDKCYNEFERFNDIGDGMFCITNIDKGVEYRFKVKNNKIYKVKKQSGGQPEKQDKIETQLKELSRLDEEGGEEPENVKILNNIKNIDVNVNTANKNITDVANLVQTANKNVLGVSGQVDNNSKKIDTLTGLTQQINTKIQQQVPQQIIQKEIIRELPKDQINDQKSEELKDIFDDIDVFDRRLRELTTMKKIESLEEKYSNNYCVIL